MEVRDYLPPVLVRRISTMFYGIQGGYSTWEEAAKSCDGYADPSILQKVSKAVEKVKMGQAVFERDSVIFDKIHYSFPLLTALSLTALADKRLSVLDFGGSLGSSYYQNRKVLEKLIDLEWSIIEQPHWVDEGKKRFEDQQLKFYHTISQCMSARSVNFVLLGSCLQYIEKPYDLLDELIRTGVGHLVIDRTPVFYANPDRITVQKVHPSIYKARYPAWVFNEQKLIDYICNRGFDCVYDAVNPEHINLSGADFKGYYFKRK